MVSIDGLWREECERDFLETTNATKYANVYCPNCNFSYQSVFKKSEVKSCPECGKKLKMSTPNGRNRPISNYTEEFAKNVIEKALDNANYNNYIAKRDVICDELGLNSRSEADIAIVVDDNRKGRVYKPEEIKLIFEVKMSLVWNWEPNDQNVPVVDADYDNHEGRPSIYRTDSILKAIGKGTILRSYIDSHKIPYLVIGNCPPPRGYIDKIDGLSDIGILQKFISINPNPLIVDKSDAEDRDPKTTEKMGYLRIDDLDELSELLIKYLEIEQVFLGKMISLNNLGRIITEIDLTKSYELIGQEFYNKLREMRE